MIRITPGKRSENVGRQRNVSTNKESEEENWLPHLEKYDEERF